MNFPEVSLYLDVRYKRKRDSRSRLTIRVHRNGYSDEYIELPGHFYTKEEYTAVLTSKRPTKEQYSLRDEIQGFEVRAREVNKRIGLRYTKASFEKELFGSEPDNTELKASFDRYIHERNEQRLKDGKDPLAAETIDGYGWALNSLMAYSSRLKRLQDITATELAAWRKWMEDKGRSKTTISIYSRYIRAVFNWEIEEGRMDRSAYPFGKSKSMYKVPAGSKRKLAVGPEVLQKIMTYNPGNGYKNKGRDFWVLTYLMSGINMADLLRIREKDFISEKELRFIRQKTKNTADQPKVITVVMTPLTWEIINRWAVRSINPEAYLFNVLKPGLTEREERRLIKNFTRTVNDSFNRMLTKMGLPRMTTYNARHSFGTMLKNAGISMEKIQEFYGHGSLTTTETYMGSVEIIEQENIMKHLIPKTG